MKTQNFLTTLCFGLLATGTSTAQSTDNANIDQIIVTGARTPLTINELGSAATIISRDEIERREARHIADLLRSVPGFSVSHTGVVGSQTQVRVRGAEANHILVLIDGVRANDPATGDEFRWEHLATGNIERIEIVRGPQSSLWGSDAVAAVVHIITRDQKPGANFDGYAEGGSNNTTNAGLNAAFGSGRWSLLGGIERLETDGENVSRTGSEKDNSDLTTASLAASFAASDALSVRLGLRAFDAYSQFDPVDFFVTGLPTDGDVATDSRNLFAHSDISIRPTGSRVSHDFNLRYFESDISNLVDGSEDSGTASERTTIAYQANVAVGEDRLSLALEHETTDFEQTGAIVFGDPNQVQEMQSTSAVVEYQGRSAERLTWIVSARADNNSDFKNAYNGRLSLAYELGDASILRGSVGTGQKNPTFIERFGFFPGQFIGNPDLKPERSTSFDVGIDHSFANDALTLQLSLFRQDLEDEINGFVFDPVTFLSTAENMSGKSRRQGVELASEWQVSERMSLTANYTYSDSSEHDSTGNEVAELRRPRHSGGLGLAYRSDNERFGASLNADYGGTRSDIFFPPWPEPSTRVTLSNYWLVDLALQLRVTESVQLFAKANNLLDEDYEQVYGYRTPGRTAYVGVRVNFADRATR